MNRHHIKYTTRMRWTFSGGVWLAGAGETSALGFKQNKYRVTVLICANATEALQVTLFVIDKYNRPRAFKGKMHLPVEYKVQSNTWMDNKNFHYWFHHIFVSVKKHFQIIEKTEERCIVLLDNCSAHPHKAELVSGNIFTIFLPANVTLFPTDGPGYHSEYEMFLQEAFPKEAHKSWRISSNFPFKLQYQRCNIQYCLCMGFC